jgi:hypothetical protein
MVKVIPFPPPSDRDVPQIYGTSDADAEQQIEALARQIDERRAEYRAALAAEARRIARVLERNAREG